MELSDRERQARAGADRLNAILSMSSIKEGSESAQVRARQQAVQRQEQRRNAQRNMELEGTLGVRQLEGEANRASALERAEVAQRTAQALTVRQRNDVSDLVSGINLIDSLSSDLKGFGDSGGETGGLGGAAEWVAEQVGFDPATNLIQQGRESANPGLEKLRAKASAVSAASLSASQKGVMTEQDFQRVKAMDLNNPNLSMSQLSNRIGAARSVLMGSLESIVGSGGAITTDSPGTTAPAVTGGNVVDFGDL